MIFECKREPQVLLEGEGEQQLTFECKGLENRVNDIEASIADLTDGKLDKTAVVQETGTGTDVVMSQKAVTDAIAASPGTGLGTLTDVNLTLGDTTVQYDTTDGIQINSTARFIDGAGNHDAMMDLDIPIVAGYGLSMDKASDTEKVQIKLDNSILNPGYIAFTDKSNSFSNKQTIVQATENGVLHLEGSAITSKSFGPGEQPITWKISSSGLQHTASGTLYSYYFPNKSGTLALTNQLGEAVSIQGPTSAIQGTLTDAQWNTLKASERNYITFNSEIYRLADKDHTVGVWSYTHTGWNGSAIEDKSINITTSTKGWVLSTGSAYAMLENFAPAIRGEIKLAKGAQLTIEPNTLYLVQGFDDNDNIQEIRTVGGGNIAGNLMLVIAGDRADSSTIWSRVIISTGSTVISNIVKTTANIQAIRPENNSIHLTYFKISGSSLSDSITTI